MALIGFEKCDPRGCLITASLSIATRKCMDSFSLNPSYSSDSPSDRIKLTREHGKSINVKKRSGTW